MRATSALGTTGMDLSRIGLGTWAQGGGGWAFGWGPQDDGQSETAIRRAVDLGINWIDTAPAYGLGHAEELVGRVEARLGANLALADRLGPVAERHGVATAAVAVAWVLAWPGVTGAIVGARRPGQLDDWVAAAGLRLDAADLDEIAAALSETGAGAGPLCPPA